MRGSRKFCQSGSNSDNVFCFIFLYFFMREEMIQIALKEGNVHLNGVSLAGR